jgi:hypothetical protein
MRIFPRSQAKNRKQMRFLKRFIKSESYAVDSIEWILAREKANAIGCGGTRKIIWLIELPLPAADAQAL